MQVRDLRVPHAERGGRRGVREGLGVGAEGQVAARVRRGLCRGGAPGRELGRTIRLNHFLQIM